MNYNIILYVGIAFYVAIFITFIMYQMHDREEDKKQWLSDQLTKAFNKEKEKKIIHKTTYNGYSSLKWKQNEKERRKDDRL